MTKVAGMTWRAGSNQVNVQIRSGPLEAPPYVPLQAKNGLQAPARLGINITAAASPVSASPYPPVANVSA